MGHQKRIQTEDPGCPNSPLPSPIWLVRVFTACVTSRFAMTGSHVNTQRVDLYLCNHRLRKGGEAWVHGEVILNLPPPSPPCPIKNYWILSSITGSFTVLEYKATISITTSLKREWWPITISLLVFLQMSLMVHWYPFMPTLRTQRNDSSQWPEHCVNLNANLTILTFLR